MGSEPREPMKTRVTSNGYTSGNHKKRGPLLPLDRRIQLHHKVLQLRRQGLSYKNIIERVHESNGIRLSKSDISGWINGKHQPLGKVNKFDAKPSPTLTYIIGAKASDAWLYHNKKSRYYEFELKTIDHEFAEDIGRRLAKLLGRNEPYEPWWDGNVRCWRVEGSSVLLYWFLRRPSGKLKPYVEHCKHCVAAFLKAFFDGEGSINGRAVKVYNTDRKLLLYIQRLLRRYFEIETTGPRKGAKAGHAFHDPKSGKVYKSKKQCYYLYIRAQSLPLFHRYIGFTIRRKQHRLTEAIQR